MKLDKNKIDVIRARKELPVTVLLVNAGVSSSSFYSGMKTDLDPVVVGKIASALGVDPIEIIAQEN